MKKISVKLDEGEIDIKSLPLGQYSELFKIIDEIPGIIAKIDLGGDYSNENLATKAPLLMSKAFPQFIRLLSVGSGQPVDQIKAYSAREAIDVVDAILEINEVDKVIEKAKKIFARGAKAAEVESTGSSGPSTN